MLLFQFRVADAVLAFPRVVCLNLTLQSFDLLHEFIVQLGLFAVLMRLVPQLCLELLDFLLHLAVSSERVALLLFQLLLARF